MDIWQISDLHLSKQEIESDAVFGDIPRADVAVILGDLSSDMTANLQWCARVVRPHMPVVYVPGNHDFHYRGIIQASAEGRHLARKLGIHFLDGDAAVVEGVRFVGGTFWSDYGVDVHGDGVTGEDNIRRNMENALGKADYKRIMNCEANRELLRPWHTAAIHERTKGFISRTLSKRFDGPTAVLTHYGPLADISQPGFEKSLTHPSYTSDQLGIIERHQPEMWLFGHIHDFVERRVGSTKIACNPRGYGHETTSFRWDYVHTI
ncbi:metallophosphoesterase [Agrobacterium salinitolerans]|nr:metallophosphoesterase [Agrobacterium salinitolerans]